MELKLVYRALRKISDWTVHGFYDEIYVDGNDRVPKSGPLIVASTHHNEIIDIATLAVTVPDRRHLSFWAKSSLFKNPIAGQILLSSGAIPVQRNPNTGGNTNHTQSTLFLATTYALARGEAVGVFPEGTSYTEPQIVQVKDGAAWSAVEYAKWEVEHGEKEEGGKLVIVPTAIVYTDKAQYRSRVLVRYGTPITVDTSGDDFLSLDYRVIVKGLTTEIERQMIDLSINAADWDTLNSARMARDILWDEERNIPLKNFVDVSQTLVDLFTTTDLSSESLPSIKRALIKYFALLHYTNISHSSLVYLFPSPAPTPGLFRAFVSHTRLRLHIFDPRTLLFLPTMLPFLPAYAMSALGVRYLSTQGEEETQAQFKGVLGGVGIGIGCTAVGRMVLHSLIRFGLSVGSPGFGHGIVGKVGDGAVEILRSFGKLLGETGGGTLGKSKRVAGTLGVLYATGWILIKWHNLFVGGNYRRFKHLLASYKIMLGLLSPRSSDIPLESLAPYTTPPPPPVNPYIKRRIAADSESDSMLSTKSTPPIQPAKELPKPRFISSRKLIRHLLSARMEATEALSKYLREVAQGDGKEKVEYLRKKGARII